MQQSLKIKEDKKTHMCFGFICKDVKLLVIVIIVLKR